MADQPRATCGPWLVTVGALSSAAILVARNCIDLNPHAGSPGAAYGWPLVSVIYGRYGGVWPIALLANTAVVIILAALCGRLVDEVRRGMPARFSLAAVFGLTAAAALLLAGAPQSPQAILFLICFGTHGVCAAACAGLFVLLESAERQWRRSPDAAGAAERRRQ